MNNPGPLVARAKSVTTAVIMLVIISMSLDLLMALASVAFGPVHPDAAAPGPGDIVQGLLALAYVPAIFVSGVVYFVWLHRSVKATAAMLDTKFPYTAGYAVGCHFIPVINLVRPFYVVRELFTQTMPRGEKLTSNLNMKIQVWWNCWILAALVGYAQVAAKAPLLDLVASALVIAAGIALIALVKDLPLLQERKLEEFLLKQSAPAEGFAEYPRPAAAAAE